jgi:shikimate dehydrogenase
MSRVDTPLLRAAAARGCRTHPGLYMLEGQIAEIARFLGIEEPRKPARALA